MNTKAAIGILYETGEILGIICHYDGYVQGVGKTLLTHYNSIDSIKALLELGTLTNLKETVEATQAVVNNRAHRHVKSMMFRSRDDFERYYAIADYFYLFESNHWVYKHGFKENTSYELLELALM